MWVCNTVLQNENLNLKPTYWLSNQYIKLEQMYYQTIHNKSQHKESLTSNVLSLFHKKNSWLCAKIVYKLGIIIIMLNIVTENFS